MLKIQNVRQTTAALEILQRESNELKFAIVDHSAKFLL